MPLALLAATEIPAAPVLVFMGCGVVIAMLGHASRSRTMVVGGLMVIFIATAMMFVGAYAAYQEGESDPRPECEKVCPKDEDEPPGP